MSEIRTSFTRGQIQAALHCLGIDVGDIGRPAITIDLDSDSVTIAWGTAADPGTGAAWSTVRSSTRIPSVEGELTPQSRAWSTDVGSMDPGI